MEPGARLIMFMHSVAVLAWVSHGIWHGSPFPDMATLSGAATFVVTPYAANKVPTMFGGKEQ